MLWINEINFLVIIVIVIIIVLVIIVIIIIKIYSSSIYKCSGSSLYKLKKNINKRIKTVKIIYKIYMINIRVP